MTSAPVVFCEIAELAVEIGRLAARIGLPVEPRVEASPLAAADAALRRGEPAAVALTSTPAPAALVAPAEAARARRCIVPAAMLGTPAARRDLARDLGFAAVAETRALVAILALGEASAPWTASARALGPLDRTRFRNALDAAPNATAAFEPADGGFVAYVADDGRHVVGDAPDVAEALMALREVVREREAMISTVEGVDRQAVTDVLVGPQRALSDPASKTALAQYDVPLPVEELCASASRAASDATRLGFPVRIALASPDLRLWDHPDLAVSAVDNAARVREVYRQLTTLGRARAPRARLLGVTVTVEKPTVALLEAKLSPLGRDLVLLRVGFADPHGLASADATETVLPLGPEGIARVVERLAGRSSIVGRGRGEARRRIVALGEALHRIAAFAHDFRDVVESIDVRPLALLVDETVEIRETSIRVGDAFQRSLELPTAQGASR